MVRNTKKEVRDKETEIVKLKESKEQLVKTIEEMQDHMKRNESEASSASKSLSAMQAVSQASTDKLMKLEAEIAGKIDELASQRRALEAAWGDNTDLKRAVAELRAERDDFKRQIGEGTSRVMETESSRRDIEQREAVLRATNKQLQDSLQRQMNEASGREERLRDEVNEMRKRWQEAITSREQMASELGSATAPLLRQISALQDALRGKTESWQTVESTLSERALRAESAAEIAEHKRSVLDEQLSTLKQQHSLTSTRLQEALSSAQAAESMSDKLRRAEAAAAERISDLESRLSLEMGQKQSLNASLRELEVRHKVELQDARDAVLLSGKQSEMRVAALQSEVESLKEDLKEARKKKDKSSALSASAIPRKQPMPQSQIPTSSSSSSSSSSDAADTERATSRGYTIMPGTLPSELKTKTK